jgi:hypothetical protein
MNSFRIARLGLVAMLTASIFACQKESSVVPAASSTTAPTQSSNAQVLTPAGYLPAQNVHFIGNGFHLGMQNGHLKRFENHTNRFAEDYGEIKLTPKQSAASGWIAYAYWATPFAPISGFTTTWTVPDAPPHKGNQTIFLFNGLQDGTTSTSYIIQPVLQWGLPLPAGVNTGPSPIGMLRATRPSSATSYPSIPARP